MQTRPERNAKSAAYMRKWRKTPSGQSSTKASRRRYYGSEDGHQKAIEYRQSINGKARRLAGQRKYSKTTKGRATQKRFWKGYVEPEHLHLKRLERGRNYYKTPNGRAVRLSHASQRRALKKGASVSDLEVIKQWSASWRSARRVRCFWCREWSSGRRCHIDHIIPLSSGGPHNIENVCISCSNCNRRKQAKTVSEWNKSLTEPALL